jgi:hypothetical protein
MEKSRNEKVILNKIGPSHHLINPNGKIFLTKVIEEAYGNLKQYTEKKFWEEFCWQLRLLQV